MTIHMRLPMFLGHCNSTWHYFTVLMNLLVYFFLNLIQSYILISMLSWYMTYFRVLASLCSYLRMRRMQIFVPCRCRWEIECLPSHPNAYLSNLPVSPNGTHNVVLPASEFTNQVVEDN